MSSKRAKWLVVGIGLVAGVACFAALGQRVGDSLLRMLPRGSADLATIATIGTNSWLAFAGLQIAVSVSGFLPASALGIAAGSIYGIGLGFALSAASSLTGAGLAFGLTRSVFRPWIERQMRRRPDLRQIDATIRRDGWRLACLIRLSPIMPFAATSYLLGLSSISFRDYCIGTLGSLPALFGYVAIGAFAGAGVHAWSSGAGLTRLGLMFAGVLASGLATFRIGAVVSAAVNRQSVGGGSVETGAEVVKRSISSR
jgi:uncharacterized membrane protein YdjX (TVP38/TMEM64 family)